MDGWMDGRVGGRWVDGVQLMCEENLTRLTPSVGRGGDGGPRDLHIHLFVTDWVGYVHLHYLIRRAVDHHQALILILRRPAVAGMGWEGEGGWGGMVSVQRRERRSGGAAILTPRGQGSTSVETAWFRRAGRRCNHQARQGRTR